MLTYPNIDPVIFSIGGISLRWYSLAYIAGIIIGWRYLEHIENWRKSPITNKKQRDDMISWAILGIILGGRIGYVLFYNLSYYMENPSNIIKIWQGGMSFHGGLVGSIIALYIYSSRNSLPFLKIMDNIAIISPIGLFFGRIANFINGELYGRITSSPIGMIFPNGGALPRHPSQLYEAFLEGLVLLIILSIIAHYSKALNKTGMLAGLFLIFYSSFRFAIEYFREPDIQIGLISGLSMGQILCIPMLLIGIYLSIIKNNCSN